uniref:Uncharacterized protein n=1 Tax=Bionectria ochroleuca TaxID=29856 RepID=A0A0B7K5U0_BIOOC
MSRSHHNILHAIRYPFVIQRSIPIETVFPLPELKVKFRLWVQFTHQFCKLSATISRNERIGFPVINKNTALGESGTTLELL